MRGPPRWACTRAQTQYDARRGRPIFCSSHFGCQGQHCKIGRSREVSALRPFLSMPGLTVHLRCVVLEFACVGPTTPKWIEGIPLGDPAIVALCRRKMDGGRCIMGPPIGHMIRHIRYEEFVALRAKRGDFDGFLAAVEALMEQMGDVASHHVLVDLKAPPSRRCPRPSCPGAAHPRRRGRG